MRVLRVRQVGLAAAMAMVVLGPSAVAEEGGQVSVERLAGTSRVGTAVAVSQYLSSGRCGGCEGGAEGTVVLASADAPVDTFLAVPLAAGLGVPLLLTYRDVLPAEVAGELRRLGAESALVVGGPASVADSVLAEIEAAGVGRVDRLAGADRYATSAAVSGQVPPGGDGVVVAGGQAGWQDWAGAASLAAVAGTPLLLSPPVGLPDSVGASVRQRSADEIVVVVGGVDVISEEIESFLGDIAAVDRVAGPDRLATAALLARRSLSAGADLGAVWVASAESPSDAVAAAAGAGRSGGVLLLASDGQGPGASESLELLSEGGARVDSLVLVGGPDALETTSESRLVRAVTDAPFQEFALRLVVDEPSLSRSGEAGSTGRSPE